jgi:LysM repeat protein
MNYVKEDRRSGRPVRGSRIDRRWALVFVGKHSNTIAFNHLKAVVVATVLLIVALGCIAAGSVYYYRRAAGDILTLEKRLAALNRSRQALLDEKDILVARLALVESQSDQKTGGKEVPGTLRSKTPATDETVAAGDPEPQKRSAAPEKEKTVYHVVEPGDSLYAIGFRYNVSVEQLRRLNRLKREATLHPGDRLVIRTMVEENPSPGGQQNSPEGSPVAKGRGASLRAKASATDIGAHVRNFSAVYEPASKSLGLEYVIQNDGSKSRQISGQTVVVLKNGEDSPERWLVLPPVALRSGRPDGKSGSGFSIFDFRTIRFRVDDLPDVQRYTHASVYVFTTEGQLALEKEFPLQEHGLQVQR